MPGIRNCIRSFFALVFVRSESDYAIYCRGVRSDRLVVGVYVDDLVITGSRSEEI
jgi:hypothetical protein